MEAAGLPGIGEREMMKWIDRIVGSVVKCSKSPEDEMEIKLDEARNMYVVKGKLYPRLSEVVEKGIGIPELDRWKERTPNHEEIGKELADYGTMVHTITEYHDKGEQDKVSEMLWENGWLVPHLMNWISWCDTYVKEWIHVEKTVWSEKWGVAGKIDRVGIMVGDKQPSIVDIKTGGLYDIIGVKLHGYKEMFNERENRKTRKVERLIAVQLPRKDPEKRVVKEYTSGKIRTGETYIEAFRRVAKDWKALNL